MGIAKRLAAEGLGTALLLLISGGCALAAARAGGDAALVGVAGALVSSVGLAVLILTFGPVSGGHFNPVLTLSEAVRGRLPPEHAMPYIAAQLAGAALGLAAAHGLFGLPLAASTQAQDGAARWLGEALATFGLLMVFIGAGRSRPALAPFVVPAYVMAACCFSSAYMNPAMALAHVFGDGAGGIRLADAPAIILAQLAGAAAATALSVWLHPAPVRGGSA